MGNLTVHYYRGLINVRKHGANQFASDSVLVMAQPRLTGGGRTTTNASTATELDAAPAGTELAVIAPDPGERLYVEIINEAWTAVATSGSPVFDSEAIIQMQPGWSLSVLDVS